jgi:hypothetical protein
VTPGQAADFYEDDEDPREVFARFDASPPDGVTEPPCTCTLGNRCGPDGCDCTTAVAGCARHAGSRTGRLAREAAAAFCRGSGQGTG